MSSGTTRVDSATQRRIHGAPVRRRLATITPIPARRHDLEGRWPFYVMVLVLCLFATVFVKYVFLPASETVAGSAVDGGTQEGP